MKQFIELRYANPTVTELHSAKGEVQIGKKLLINLSTIALIEENDAWKIGTNICETEKVTKITLKNGKSFNVAESYEYIAKQIENE